MGTSPKLTSFWRGQFEVLQKCSDYTYLVSCGFKGSSQVIHVDRMNLVKPQLLTCEGTLKGLEPPQSDEFDNESVETPTVDW